MFSHINHMLASIGSSVERSISATCTMGIDTVVIIQVKSDCPVSDESRIVLAIAQTPALRMAQ